MEEKLDIILKEIRENKNEFNSFREEIKSEVKEIRGEFKSFRDEIKSEVKEIRGEFKSFRDEIKSEVGEFKSFRDEVRDGFDAVLLAVKAVDGRLTGVEKDVKELKIDQKELHRKFDRLKASQKINRAILEEHTLRLEDLEGAFQPVEE